MIRTIATFVGVIALVVVSLVGTAAVLRAAEFGSSWSEQGTNVLPVAISQHTTLAFNDQLWVIGGDVGGTAQRKVYSSSDGTTWAEVGTDALPAATRNHCSVTVQGNSQINTRMWVVGGEDSAGTAQNDIYYSEDGASWSAAGLLPGNRTNLTCVKRGGILFFIGGDDGTSPQNDVYFCALPDCFATGTVGEIPANRADASALLALSDLWVIGGDSGAIEEEVYRSLNSVDWSTSPSLPVKRSRGGALSVNGRLYYFGGIDATTPVTSAGQDDVLVSLPGESWAYVGNGALPVNIYDFGYIMFQGKAWITGGNVGGTQVSTVYATDDVGGLSVIGDSEEPLGVPSSDVTFTDQSGDTPLNQLPFMDMVQLAESQTGYPWVSYTVYVIYIGVCMILLFYLARLAPNSRWISALAVIGVTIIGYNIGLEAISWYVLISVTLLLTGIASITGRILQ